MERMMASIRPSRDSSMEAPSRSEALTPGSIPAISDREPIFFS